MADTASSAPSVSAPKPAPPQPTPFTARLALGLFGVLLAAMASGLNSRVPGLALNDITAQMGISADQMSWVSSLYSAGELIAMPFASWFAITFSLRRFHLSLVGCMLALAVIMPFVRDFHLLAGLRLLQGICAGGLIPLLMMSALRFLPPPIRLHGLALYAMTATLAPNVAVWLAAFFLTDPVSLTWVYWHIIPIGLFAAALIYYGIPELPVMLPRLKQGNWLGMALGVPGLGLLALGLGQGVRLEWFDSSVDSALLISGSVLTILFLYTEWHHDAPFMRLQMLSRRNLWLAFTIFFCLLIALNSAVVMPMNVLMASQGLRIEQLTSLGLIVGVPQVILGSVVALLLYQCWVDARKLLAFGLLILAAACYLASGLTSSWVVEQFFWAQVLQAIGQPIAVVAMLFVGTSAVQPMEGPFVAGIINALRALGTLVGAAFVGQLAHDRGQFHSEMLMNQAGLWISDNGSAAGSLAQTIASEATVLANADIYRIFMVILLLLVPAALSLKYTPAPVIVRPPSVPKPAVDEQSSVKSPAIKPTAA